MLFKDLWSGVLLWVGLGIVADGVRRGSLPEAVAGAIAAAIGLFGEIFFPDRARLDPEMRAKAIQRYAEALASKDDRASENEESQKRENDRPN